MKKLFAAIMIVCLILCLAACGETAEEPAATTAPAAATTVPEETPLPKVELEYDHTKFVMDGVVLVAYIGNDETCEIPDKTMKIADNAFKNCKTVKSVTIPDTVTEVGAYAFYGCDALENLNVPKLVKVIGKYAFANCKNLKKVETKTNATNVGEYCFADDVALEEAVISSSLLEVKEGLFKNCAALKEIKISSAQTIAVSAFEGCKALTKIDAPTVQTIADNAFKGCAALENGNFSSALTSLGRNAFEGTKWLDDVKAAAKAATKTDEAYVYIGKDILVYCSGIVNGEKIESDKLFTAKTKVIGSEAFAEFADELEILEIPTTVIKIEKGAFENFTKLTEATVSMNISELPDDVFANCANLEKITILGKVARIGDNAFANCTALSEISEKKTAEKKEDAPAATEAPAATDNAIETAVPEATEEPAPTEPAIYEFVLPAALETIGDKAFFGCEKIDGAIVLGESVTSIGSEAFAGCKLVADVRGGAKVSKVLAKAFDGTTWFDSCKEDIIIGDGVLIKAADCKKIPEGTKTISISLDGITALDKKQFYANKELYAVVIPEGVKEIADYAFYYAENLTQVILPESLTKIGAYAFYGCKNLTTIVLPAAVTEIGDYAFYGCSDLKTINLDNIATIGKFAFYDCLSLADVNVANLKNVGAYAFTNSEWFDNVTDEFTVINGQLVKYYGFDDKVNATGFNKIIGGAFAGTYRLKEITLPATCTEIGEFGFAECDTLEKITAPSVSVIGARAFNYCRSLTQKLAAANVAADAYTGCEKLA